LIGALERLKEAFREATQKGYYECVRSVCSHAKVVDVSVDGRAVYSCKKGLRNSPFTAWELKLCEKCRYYVPALLDFSDCHRLLEEGLAAVSKKIDRLKRVQTKLRVEG